MVYKFLNEYLAKLSLLTASKESEAGGDTNRFNNPGVPNDGPDKIEQSHNKFTARSSVSSIFDFNDRDKIEK